MLTPTLFVDNGELHLHDNFTVPSSTLQILYDVNLFDNLKSISNKFICKQTKFNIVRKE